MAKAVAEKKYSSFVKGLITEANALTFPENSSLDEENFDLKIDGSRYRRLGIDYESGHAITATGIPASALEGTKKSFHRWDFPGGAADVVIGVIRAYNKLWFVNLLEASPSAALLNGGAAITISGLANSEIDTAVLNNLFVLVSKDLDYPILLEYNPSTQLIAQSTYPIQVRDVWGVNDGLALQFRPSALSDNHRYNLFNQGWSDTISSTCAAGAVTTSLQRQAWSLDSSGVWQLASLRGISFPSVLSCMSTTLGVYPSNADIWTLGKVADVSSADYEKFDPNSLAKNSVDNVEAPKGTIILDAFKRGYSRYITTGLSMPLDEESGNLSCVAAYAGRFWYSGVQSYVNGGDAFSPNYSGYVFFSQVATGKDKLGKCYQEADPTSPNISDIVDTDGGAIQLPEASHVIKLVPVKDSLLVFSENGVWEIYGDTGGFKATNYQTAKVSSIGSSSPRSIIVAGNIVFYWANAGIFMLSPDQATGRYVGTSISVNTIQTFYNNLSDLAKKHARGIFDDKENHIRWLYNDADTTTYSEVLNINNYTKQLNLDLSLNAFYKFSVSSLATNSPYIADFIVIPPYSSSTVTMDVYSTTDPVLVGADPVVVNASTLSGRTERYSLLTFKGTDFTISKYSNTSFLDWETADGAGVDYSSYLITGYDTFGEVMRSKQIPYIFFYLSRTEDGFTADGAGNLIPNNQSSCLVQAQWGWANSSSSGKWGTPFQAYRYTRSYIPSGPADTFDTGDSLIVTRNKLRGSGKALSLKIYSETGKDLQLLGWSVSITGDGKM